MKKILLFFSLIIFSVTVLSGCDDTKQEEDNNKINIVTTIFPEYDWVREITKGNENIELSMLLDKGVDLHSFQPTADDIVKVSSCDMFIYVGGESDKWVQDALAEAVNKEMVVINLLEILGENAKEEEIVEGMENGEENEEENENAKVDVEYDEHVWLSLKNAEKLCSAISDGLIQMDPANEELYISNVSSFVNSISELDKKYEETVNQAAVKTVLFGDRFPFRYMVDDYGISYYAAFSGCSAESEASFETIKFLAEKTDELGLGAILQIENADGKIAQTIIDTTAEKNQKVLTLNSMQAVTLDDVNAGVTYFSIMESNLEVLKQALN